MLKRRRKERYLPMPVSLLNLLLLSLSDAFGCGRFTFFVRGLNGISGFGVVEIRD